MEIKNKEIKREDKEINKEDWYTENASHGAFALTQEEIDWYYNTKLLKTPIW
mgnify:CR=1 FL=1